MTAAARFTVRLVGTAALAGIGFIGGSVARARWLDAPTSTAPAAALAIDHTADLTAGPATAAVTVRIFGDYGCPACRQLEHALGDTLLALAHAGAIRLVYLHRPLTGRRGADSAAAIIACEPDPARRWMIHARLYEAAETAASDEQTSLATRSTSILVDTSVTACARSDSTIARMAHGIAAARGVGFHEVPTVLVNDLHVRFRTHAALLRHIHRAIAAARRAPVAPRRSTR